MEKNRKNDKDESYKLTNGRRDQSCRALSEVALAGAMVPWHEAIVLCAAVVVMMCCDLG